MNKQCVIEINVAKCIVDRLKPSDYDMSLRKYWRENVTSDSESNVGDITTMLYIPTIDRIVYGLGDGAIVILPAIEFLFKHIFERAAPPPTSSFKPSNYNIKKITQITLNGNIHQKNVISEQDLFKLHFS